MSQFVKLAVERGVARLTLDRPEKRNALCREMIVDLRDAVRRVASEPEARVLVLAATGDVFCAGMDLGEMQQRAAADDPASELLVDSRVYADLLHDLFRLPLPTVAAVQGPVLAGGMGLVCACDIVIAAESAYFLLPEPARGITAAMVTPLLVHRIGPGPASAMLLSMEKLSAFEALRTGLCRDVVPGEGLDSRVNQLVDSILTGSPAALALTKRHINQCLAAPVEPLIRQSVEVSSSARESDDAREGVAAFLEKRKARWQH